MPTDAYKPWYASAWICWMGALCVFFYAYAYNTTVPVPNDLGVEQVQNLALVIDRAIIVIVGLALSLLGVICMATGVVVRSLTASP